MDIRLKKEEENFFAVALKIWFQLWVVVFMMINDLFDRESENNDTV